MIVTSWTSIVAASIYVYWQLLPSMKVRKQADVSCCMFLPCNYLAAQFFSWLTLPASDLHNWLRPRQTNVYGPVSRPSWRAALHMTVFQKPIPDLTAYKCCLHLGFGLSSGLPPSTSSSYKTRLGICHPTGMSIPINACHLYSLRVMHFFICHLLQLFKSYFDHVFFM